MNFCNGRRFRTKIAKLLAGKLLFDCRHHSVIMGWYDTFIDNRIKSYGINSLGVPLTTLDGISTFSKCIRLGHDLPVWYTGGDTSSAVWVSKNDKNDVNVKASSDIDHKNVDFRNNGRRRVMVIGQDPLRDGDVDGLISIMSPWGLHYPEGFAKQHSKTYNYLFNPLVQNFDVYVTDFWKIYGYGNLRDGLSLSIFNFADILKEEIRLFNPSSILILSNDYNVYEPIIDAIKGLICGADCVSPIPTTPPTTIPPTFSSTPITTFKYSTLSSIKVICASHPNNHFGKTVIGYYYGYVISLL